MSRAPWRSLETKEGSLSSRKWLTNESMSTKSHGSRPPFMIDQRAVTLSPQSNRHIGRRNSRQPKAMTMETMLPSSNGIHEKSRYHVPTMETAEYSTKKSLSESTQVYFSQSGRSTDSQHTKDYNTLNNFSNCQTNLSQDHLLSESSRESQGKVLPASSNCHTNAVQQLFKLLSSSTYRGPSPSMYGNQTTRVNSGSEKNAYVNMFPPVLEGSATRNSLQSGMSEKNLVDDSSRFQHSASSITPQDNSILLPPQGNSMMHGSLSNLAELLTQLQGKQAPVAAAPSFGNAAYLSEPVQKTNLFMDGHQNKNGYGTQQRMSETFKQNHLLHNSSQYNVKMFQETSLAQPCDFPNFYEQHAYTKEYSEDRLPQDRLAQDRLPQDRLIQDRLPQDRLIQDRLPQDRMAQERLAQDRLPQDRMAQDRVPQDRMAQERLAQDRLSQDRMAQERLAQDRLSQDRMAQDRLVQDRLTQDRLPQDRTIQDRLVQDRLTQNRLAQERLSQEAYQHREQRQDSQQCEILSKYPYHHPEFHESLQRNTPTGLSQLHMPPYHQSRRVEQRPSVIQPKSFPLGNTMQSQSELLRQTHAVLSRHHQLGQQPAPQEHILKSDLMHSPNQSQQHFNQQNAASYTGQYQNLHSQEQHCQSSAQRNASLPSHVVNGGNHFLNSQHESTFHSDHSQKIPTTGNALHGSMSQQQANLDTSYTVSPHASRFNDASEQLRFSSQLQSIISRLSKDQMRSTGSSTEVVPQSHASCDTMHYGREQTNASLFYDKPKPLNNKNATERWNPSNVSQWTGASHPLTPHSAQSQNWNSSHLNSRVAPVESNRLCQPMAHNFNGNVISGNSKVTHLAGYDTVNTQIVSSAQPAMTGLPSKSLKRDHLVKNGEKYPFARNNQTSRPSLSKHVWSPSRSRHSDRNRWTDNDKRLATNSDTSRWTSRLKEKYSNRVSKVSATRNPGKASLHRGRHKETFKVTRVSPSRQTNSATSRYSRYTEIGKSPRHSKERIYPLRSSQTQQTSFKKDSHLNKLNSKISPKKTRTHFDTTSGHNTNSNSFTCNETQKLDTQRLKNVLRGARRSALVSSQSSKKHSKANSENFTLYDDDLKKKMALFFEKTIQELINAKESFFFPLLLTRVDVFEKSEKEINATCCRLQNIMPTFWVMSLLYYLETMWSRLRDTLLQEGCPRLAEKFSPCLLITNLPNVNACALQRALSNHFKGLRLPVDKFYLPIYPETGFSMGWCILHAGNQWKQIQNIISAPQFQWRGMCSQIHPFPCPQFLQLNASLTIASHRSKSQAAVNVGDWQPSHFNHCASIIYPAIKSFIHKIRVKTSSNTQSFQTSYIGNPVPFMVISSNRRLKFSIPIAAPNYSAQMTSLLLEDELKTIACSFPSNLCLPLTDDQKISYSSSIPTKCNMVDVNHQHCLDIVNEHDTEQLTKHLSEETLTQPTQVMLANGPIKNVFSEEIDIVVSSPKTCEESLSHAMVIDRQQKDKILRQKVLSEESQVEFSTSDSLTKDITHEEVMLEENLNMRFSEEAMNKTSLVEESMQKESLNEASLVEETMQEESLNKASLVEETMQEESLNEASLVEETMQEKSINEGSLDEESLHAEDINKISFGDESLHVANSSDPTLVQKTLPAEILDANSLIEESLQGENCVTCPAGTEGDMEVSHSDEDSSSLNYLVDMKMKNAKSGTGVPNTCSLEMKVPLTTWALGDPGFFFSEECKTNCYPTILSTSHSGTNQVSKRHGVGKVLSSRVLFPELPSIPHDGELAVVKPITKEDDFGFLSLFQHGHHSLLSWELLLQFLHVYLMGFRTIAENKLENPAITSVASWSFFFSDETEGLSMHNIWETLSKMNTTFRLNLTDVVSLSHVLQITRIPNVKRTNHEFVRKLQHAIFTTLNLNENDYSNEVWGPQYYIFAETERFRGNALFLLPSQQPVSSILSSQKTCEQSNLLHNPYTIQVEVEGATYPVEITRSLRPSVEIDWELQIICKMVSVWSLCVIKKLINEHEAQLSHDNKQAKPLLLTDLVTELPTFTEALSLEMDEVTKKIQLEQTVGRLMFDLSICSAFHFLQTYFFSVEQFFTLPLFKPYIKVEQQAHNEPNVQNQVIRVTNRLYQRLQNCCNHTLPNIFLDPSTRALVHYKEALQLFNVQDTSSIQVDSLIASYPEAEIPINDVLHHLRHYIEEHFNDKTETLDSSQKKHHLQWLMFENEPDWQATVRIPSIQFKEHSTSPTHFEMVGTTFPSPSKAKAACALQCLKYFANLEETLLLALGVKEHADDWMDIRCVDGRSTLNRLNTAEQTSTLSIELQPTQWIQLNISCDNDLVGIPLKPFTDLLCESNTYWTPIQLKELEKNNRFRYVPLRLTLSTPYHRYLLSQAVQTEFRSQDHLYKWMHHNLLFQPKEEDIVAQQIQSFFEKIHPPNSAISMVPS